MKIIKKNDGTILLRSPDHTIKAADSMLTEYLQRPVNFTGFDVDGGLQFVTQGSVADWKAYAG